jgi:hypothetical protein
MKTIIQFTSTLKLAAMARLTILKSFGAAALKISGCLIILATINGCVTCSYAPSAQNVPLFKEKNDANLSTAFKFGLLTIGCDLQGAYAISNHIGLTANYNYFNGREETGIYGDDYSGTYKSHLGEFGLGYYLPFKDKMVFETYGGMGWSKITEKYEINYSPASISLGSTFYFVQPAIGFYHKNVEFAISMRGKLVDFNKGQFDPWLGLNQYYYSQISHVAFFIEPAFTFRAGGKNVKFQAQAGFVLPTIEEDILTYDPVNINIGLIFSLHGKKKGEVK